MRHPFETIPQDRRRAIFVGLLLLTIAVMAMLNGVDGPLKTEAAPQGIVSFELAGDVPTTRAILDSWDLQARVHAGFSLGLDYLFMALYSTTIACACAWISGGLRDSRRSLALAGLFLAWGQWLAALLDGVENGALWVTLLNGAASPWPQLALWCAAIKFLLVFLGLAYALLGGAWAWYATRKTQPQGK